MAIDVSGLNLTALEKAAGKKAARTIQRNFRDILATSTVKNTGRLLRSARVSPSMKYDMLDSLVIKASPATFIQHYGFEGIKSNGIRMSMKPMNHFGILFNRSERTLEKLLAEITEIRGGQITSKIQQVIKFNFDKSQQ